jgi:hypothetical protein
VARLSILDIMKPLACISVFSLLMTGCVSHPPIESDTFFLPCKPEASVLFEGENEAGLPEIHRLEVRRLAYILPTTKEVMHTMGSCVIYYHGDDHGPSVLCNLDDCANPMVRRVSTNLAEVYYIAGAHTHFRQTWELLGHTAILEKKEVIEWSDDPRNKNNPN